MNQERIKDGTKKRQDKAKDSMRKKCATIFLPTENCVSAPMKISCANNVYYFVEPQIFNRVTWNLRRVYWPALLDEMIECDL